LRFCICGSKKKRLPIGQKKEKSVTLSKIALLVWSNFTHRRNISPNVFGFFRPKMIFFRSELVANRDLDFANSREFSGRVLSSANREVKRFVDARIVGSRLRRCAILNISDISLTVQLKICTSPRRKIGRRREAKFLDPPLFLRSTLFSFFWCGSRFFPTLPKTQIIVKFSKRASAPKRDQGGPRLRRTRSP